MHSNENIAIRVRTYFSIRLLRSIAEFHRLSIKTEKKLFNASKSIKRSFPDAYVVGAIFCAVAFLEAVINEIYEDSKARMHDTGSQKKYRRVRNFDDALISRLAGCYDLMPRTYSTLAKYNIALILADKKPFDEGFTPYDDVTLIISLRNAFVHYKPKWVTTVSEIEPDTITDQDLERKLKGKFPLNPIAGKANPFFPDKCISVGCVNWVATSIITFVNEFYERMNIPNRFDYNPKKRESEEYEIVGT